LAVIYRVRCFSVPLAKRHGIRVTRNSDIVETTRSPGLRRMMARAGSRSTFKEGRDDLKIYAGIEVSAKDVERVAEGMGQQMEAWASQERKVILRDHQLQRSEKTIPILYITMMGPECQWSPKNSWS